STRVLPHASPQPCEIFPREIFGDKTLGRWILGGCPPGTDPSVTVPVALGCRCGRCPIAAADCAVLGLGPSFCGAPGGFGGS
uniref:Glycoprotein hormone subunit beta domain-containing protein n=1 Tax=Catharus ustulatus TaxID=91951 RepID=A0A8C3UVR5_CATUS